MLIFLKFLVLFPFIFASMFNDFFPELNTQLLSVKRIMRVNDEFGRIWAEVVVDCFKT